MQRRKAADNQRATQTVLPGVSLRRSRFAVLNGQRSVLKEKIAQLEHQIVGGEAQVKAYRSQLASTQKEIESNLPLVNQGLIAAAL